MSLLLFKVVIYLRQLPKLRTLSLKGNPVANIKDFDGYVAAFLPKVFFGVKNQNKSLEVLFTPPPDVRALRALGLLLADGASSVGWGKTFCRIERSPS